MCADSLSSMTSHKDVTACQTTLLEKPRSLEKKNVLQQTNPSVDDSHCENGQQDKEFSFVKPAGSREEDGKENGVVNRRGKQAIAARRRAASIGGNWRGLGEKIYWQANELQNENGAICEKPRRGSPYGGRRKLGETFAKTDRDSRNTFYDMQQRNTTQTLRKKSDSKYKRVERGYRDMEHGVTWLVDEQTWRMLGSMQGVPTKGSGWKDSTQDVDTCANCGDSGFENWLGCQTRTFDVSEESEQACSEEGDGTSYRNLDNLESFVDILSDTHQEQPVVSGKVSGAKKPERFEGSLSRTHQDHHVASRWDPMSKKEKMGDAENVELRQALSATVGVLKNKHLGGKTPSSELCDFPVQQHKKTVQSRKSTLFSEFFPKKVTSFGHSLLNQKSILSNAGLTGFRGIVVSIFHLVCVSMIKRGK